MKWRCVKCAEDRKWQQHDVTKYETHFEFQWEIFYVEVYKYMLLHGSPPYGLYWIFCCNCCWNNNPQTMPFRSHEHIMYGSVLLFAWSMCTFAQRSLLRLLLFSIIDLVQPKRKYFPFKFNKRPYERTGWMSNAEEARKKSNGKETERNETQRKQMEIGYKTETQILVDILLFRINTNTKGSGRKKKEKEAKSTNALRKPYGFRFVSLWLLEK